MVGTVARFWRYTTADAFSQPQYSSILAKTAVLALLVPNAEKRKNY